MEALATEESLEAVVVTRRRRNERLSVRRLWRLRRQTGPNIGGAKQTLGELLTGDSPEA